MSTEITLPMVAIAVSIAAAEAGIIILVAWLAGRIHNSGKPLPEPELRLVDCAYRALSDQEKQMLLVAACEDAVRRLQPDGKGIVRANVLGYSWQVDGQQMSTFLAWVRGKTVYHGKAIWRARVEARPDERTSLIIFEKEYDISITVSADVSAFRVGLQSVQDMLGEAGVEWKPKRKVGLS